jgi:hypothetical protein
VFTQLKGFERWLAALEDEQMTNLPYPSWQKPYHEALLEFGPEKLEEKIMTAETAIFQRFQELTRANGMTSDERGALNDALRALQVEKLHYPKLPNELQQNE